MIYISQRTIPEILNSGNINGYEIIEYLCEINGIDIEIIDNTEYSKEQELTDDFIQATTMTKPRRNGKFLKSLMKHDLWLNK